MDTAKKGNSITRKEYIEREAAIAFMNEVEPCICYNPDGAVFTATKDSDMLEFLRAIPAADVVPVVRCGDCKWFQINMRQDGYLPKGVPECECRHWCGACYPTDFCSYGALIDKDGDIDGV